MFYLFSQNNSGGYYIEDENLGISERIFIEAKSKEQALSIFNEIAEKYGQSAFYEYCTCCGERWNDISGSFEDEKGIGKHMADYYNFIEAYSIIKLDGTIENYMKNC